MSATTTTATPDTEVLAGERVLVTYRNAEGEPVSYRLVVERELEAIVQLGQLDPPRWMIGIGVAGWMPDEYPTAEAAVQAAVTPRIRKALLAMARWARDLAALEAKLREHYATMPAAPEGACDRWPTRTIIGPN
jgi:hypothetical protein